MKARTPVRAVAIVSATLMFAGHPLAEAREQFPQRPVVVVPGIMGSKLCRLEEDGSRTVVWGTLGAVLRFSELRLGGSEEPAHPCGLIREMSYLGIYTQDLYAPFLDRLEEAGYREGTTLLTFDYDWRRSVFDNAARLDAFVKRSMPDGGKVDIVAHSMGGLIARAYILREGGTSRVNSLITAGSPWRGAVRILQMLENGWGKANFVFGGLDEFRRIVLSFPAIFDLMPAYDSCCEGDFSTQIGFDASRQDAWKKLNWDGIERSALPDLEAARKRRDEIRTLVETRLPPPLAEALVVGVDQRTTSSYRLTTGNGPARIEFKTSWDGDGTVMTDSSILQDRVVYRTSFAAHGAILNDETVQDFVLAALKHGPETAVRDVPVRKRSTILSALGEAVELVGVGLVTDEPAYHPGRTAVATVHVRLGTDKLLDPDSFELRLQFPDGRSLPLPLRPDPARVAPGVQLEQAFSAPFDTGSETGALRLTLTLEDMNGTPRVVTRSVPVVRR